MKSRRRLGARGIEHEPALGAAHDDTYRDRPIGQTGDEPALRAMPAVTGVTTFAELYQQRRASTGPAVRWLVALGVVAIAGPLGVLGAFAAVTAQLTLFGILAIVFLGPAVEEITKAVGAAVIVERYPWLVPAAWAIPVMTVAGGLGFAVIENWVYLNVYIQEPTEAIIRWRWILGPTVHGVASLLVGMGLRRSWLTAHRTGRAPSLLTGQRWIIAAIAFHGTYNLTAVILSAADVI